MLQPASSFDANTRFDFLFRGVDAFDPDTGATLERSNGRSASVPKWFLFFADDKDAEGKYRPYREYRHIFRAWTLEEAIEHANKKLTQLSAKGKVGRTEH